MLPFLRHKRQPGHVDGQNGIKIKNMSKQVEQYRKLKTAIVY